MNEKLELFLLHLSLLKKKSPQKYFCLQNSPFTQWQQPPPKPHFVKVCLDAGAFGCLFFAEEKFLEEMKVIIPYLPHLS
jgi:hypothetical protein